MKTRSTVRFFELRDLLGDLGYSPRQTSKGWLFTHPSEQVLVFRLYRDGDEIQDSDLVSTQFFLDSWGLLASEEFDNHLKRSPKPA